MSTPVDDIKTRLDAVELIQTYLKVTKAGANYKANCPFHGEKTPSFMISPSKQIWHCFGCGRGGDIFKFVMEIEGLDFAEALKMLAQKAGVVLKRENPQIRSEKNRLYDLCEEASLVFEKSLALTPAVRNYLKKRGVGDTEVKEFRLGYAPQSWDFLLRSLTARGFKKEEAEKAGLAVKSEDKSSWYDRFRNRIMFPITDANSRVIGFGGRVFDALPGQNKKDEAKYVNTPNTPIYDKSNVLYGFDRAKNEIRAQNRVVVVEGYMDCLMSHKAGVKNTIAVSGTALTPLQLKTLRRLCDTMITSFDTDAAGESATRRSLALASQFEFERKIAAIPAGKDPADAVLENPQFWVSAVNEAKPVVEFFFKKTFREKNPNHINGKKEISFLLLPLVAELANEIEKSHWVAELAKRLEVSEESVWKELRRGRPGTQPAYPVFESSPKTPPTRRDMLEERMLILLPLVSAETRARELAAHNLIFVSDLNQKLFAVLQNGLPEKNLAGDFTKTLEMLKFKGEMLAEVIKNVDEDFMACKKELEKISIREELQKLQEKIKMRETAAQPEELQALLQSFQSLSSKLKTL